jgi:aminoglycoside phosphotransferase (APT) family kinase protein
MALTSAGPALELDEANIAGYLEGRGLVAAGEAVAVRRLSGGYVNNVFRAETGGRALILKQSLPAAQRTVLTAGIGRALFEVAAMKAIRECLGPRAPIPTIVDDDPANYVAVMTPAPDSAVLYDSELLDGRLHPGTGRRLGTYAGHLHARTEGRADVAAAFADNPGFALRDQTIRSVAAAHPDLAAVIDDALRRNRTEARVLVDADITPKNVLVHAGGITKLDFECTQWGHPALDVGIVVAHYVLLGFARPVLRHPLLGEARECYDAYTALRPEARSPAFAADVALYAALMMLGRADGALVFDYLIPHRPRLRVLAADLCAAPAGIDEILTLAAGRGP